MKQQICNNCGNNLGLLDKGHLVDGKIVCGKCIKILAPGRPKQRINYTKIAAKAIDRATEQTVKALKANEKARKANEDARYAKAKRRVVFFLNGCITFFWVIVLLHLLAVAVVSFIIITGIG